MRSCQVNIARLPPALVRSLAQLSEGPSQEETSVSWISPGCAQAPDVPSDDSIDELIRSSSESGRLSTVLVKTDWGGVILVIVCDLFLFLFDR